MAALLMPELVSSDPQYASGARSANAAKLFDELIDWIRAHLSQSLSMTDLSSRSGFSRDQLVEVFWHHFGCSPMRWIQRERLMTFEKALKSRAYPSDSAS
jgi:AraC family transcriptional activator FtrA